MANNRLHIRSGLHSFVPAPLPPLAPYANLLELVGPDKVREAYSRGFYYHPNRQYTSMIPSLSGPLNICPACPKVAHSELERDIHYLEQHMLRIHPSYVDVIEIPLTSNFDGPLGKRMHVLETHVYCDEPEAYADDNGDVIEEINYMPPAHCYFWKNGARRLNVNLLSPRGRIWWVNKFNANCRRQNAARKTQENRDQVLGS